MLSGGKGVVLEYRVTAERAFLTVTFSRTNTAPWGLAGAHPGTPNRCEVIRRDGRREFITMATALPVERGELIRITTGTGGGYGDPLQRDPAAVARDLRNGFITTREAKEIYRLRA